MSGSDDVDCIFSLSALLALPFLPSASLPPSPPSQKEREKAAACRVRLTNKFPCVLACWAWARCFPVVGRGRRRQVVGRAVWFWCKGGMMMMMMVACPPPLPSSLLSLYVHRAMMVRSPCRPSPSVEQATVDVYACVCVCVCR